MLKIEGFWLVEMDYCATDVPNLNWAYCFRAAFKKQAHRFRTVGTQYTAKSGPGESSEVLLA